MDILEKARILATAIKNSPEYKNYLSIKAEVEQSPEAYDMLRAYRAHQLAIGLAEFANGDVSVAVEELDDLCMQMEEDELLSCFLDAEGDLSGLMSDIQDVFASELEIMNPSVNVSSGSAGFLN